jgi:tetratricopeptide (TPR) repeat protein
MMNKDVKKILLQARHENETNWLKAIQTLLQGIEVFPEEKKFYEELGNIYFNREAFTKAANCYIEAYKLDKHNTDIVFKIAYCFLIAKEFELAIEYFDLIAERVPEAYYNKCVALYKLNQGYKAMELLEEFTANNYYSDRPFVLLGKLYLEFERYDQVIDLINRASQRLLVNGELLYIRGAAYFYTKRWLKAYLDLSNAEKSNLKSPVYYRMYALTCEKIGKTDKAISILKNCMLEFPEYYGSYYDLIKIYTLHNRYNNAIQIVDELYKKGVTLFDITGKEGSLFESVFNDQNNST